MVSIIIPVYQVSDYIERCICSVMSQSYDNIECVIVDDATADDSIVKCERLIDEYNENFNANLDGKGRIRFKILHHEVNRGLSAARNTGIGAANGEYVYFLDGDDEITVDCITKLMAISQSNTEAEIVQGNSVMIPNDKRVKIHLDKRVPLSITSNEDISTCYHKHWIPTTAWNKLIKRSFLVEHSLMFKEGLLYEDMLWMFYVVKSLKSICFCRDVTYHYYVRPDSIVNSADSLTTGNSFYDIYSEVLNALTPKREQCELDGYVEGFCKRYMTFRKSIPRFEDLYRLYRNSTKKHGCHFSNLKLRIAKMMTKIPLGYVFIQILKDLKTNING